MSGSTQTDWKDAATVGECRVSRWTDPGTMTDHLRIDHADPTAWVSADLLDEISVLTARNEDRWTSLVDDVLTIRADNRTVVYRIDPTRYDAEQDRYFMEWPD